MTIVKNDAQFEVRDDLGIESLGDELLVLDKKNEKIHRLNQTAAIVWEGLVRGRRQEQIAAHLTDKFDITLEIARRDVDRATASLVSLDLIKAVAVHRIPEE